MAVTENQAVAVEQIHQTQMLTLVVMAVQELLAVAVVATTHLTLAVVEEMASSMLAELLLIMVAVVQVVQDI
jgi:hypothetical protein